MHRASFKERLHYAFDNSMARGPVALILWLTVIASGLVLTISLLVWASGIAPYNQDFRPGLLNILWLSFLHTLDSGAMGADHGGWAFLFSMAAMTLGGILIMSTLIGVISSGIEVKLAKLSKGRSKVIESGHTVILGWSPQVFSIVTELMEANANKPDSCIVILGDIAKTEMEDRLRGRLGDTRRTRIVCRHGYTADMNDLAMVGIHSSKSIIILSPQTEDPDSRVIKTLLAITNNPRRRKEPYHIVAELHNQANMETARLVGRGEAEFVLVPELLALITSQTCRQSGLSIIYDELLSFTGNEIYLQEEPGLYGKTFGEAVLAYENSSVIGIQPRLSAPLLNPPMDRKIEEGDRVIAVSEDYDRIRLSRARDHIVDLTAIRNNPPATSTPERTLVLGWNDSLKELILELDNYVAAGSVATVVSTKEGGEELAASWRSGLKNQTLTFRHGDTTDSLLLKDIGVQEYGHVILLCNDQIDEQEADFKTLITLVHLREIGEKYGHPFTLVSEMLDPRNRALAVGAHVDDFITGKHLVALVLAQISEDKELGPVLDELLHPSGCEIYLKLASNYVELGRPLNFYTVVESARRQGEVAIGYKIKGLSSEPSRSYGVVVNPDKSAMVTFTQWDRLILISEN